MMEIIDGFDDDKAKSILAKIAKTPKRRGYKRHGQASRDFSVGGKRGFFLRLCAL
ncbi:MAG TPA: hypothetical protein VEF34_02070 [Syntrophobacteraceae bacterium]|nr:hypothetical protein [Syntrophobacteraceae bacterium]